MQKKKRLYKSNVPKWSEILAASFAQTFHELSGSYFMNLKSNMGSHFTDMDLLKKEV